MAGKEIIRRRLEIVAHRDRDRGPRTEHTLSPALAYPEWQTFAGRRHVRLMVPTGDGSVWIATWGGVLHWWPEHERCDHYGSEHGLPGNATAALAVDDAGTVWAAGERRGVAILRASETAWENLPDFAAARVTAMAPRPGGGVYAAVQEKRVTENLTEVDHSLGVISADGAFQPLLQNELACQHIMALEIDSDGDLWSGNPWGLHRRRAEDGAVESSGTVDGGGAVTAISPTGSGSVWLGTQNGLYHYRPGPEPSFSRDDAWPREAVLALALDPANRILWLATPGRLGRIFENVWQPLAELPPGRVESLLAVPGSEAAWSGGSAGVYRITAGETRPDMSPAPVDEMGAYVTAVAPAEGAEEGAVWFGSGSGVHYYTPSPETSEQSWGSWKHFVDEPLLRDVRALMPADNGGVWAGSWQGGMQEVQPITHVPSPWHSGPVIAIQAGAGQRPNLAASLSAVFQNTPEGGQRITVSPPETQAIGQIHAVMVEDQGLWIGSSRGLFRFSKTTALWTPVEGGDDIPVQALAQDDQGRLWLGTPRGLVYRNAAGWTREQLGDVLSLAIARGTLWIGTREGLQGWTLPQPEASLAGGARYEFTMTDSGLAADLVSCLFWRPREEGYDLWACGPAGASRFSITAGEID